MKNPESFFSQLEEFAHRDLFDNLQNLWDPLKKLGTSIESALNRSPNGPDFSKSMGKTTLLSGDEPGGRMGPSIYIEGWIEADSPIFLADQKVLIGKGTILEPSAIIKGPAIIGKHCEIRQGAYIRGNVIVGNHCIIGHATEIKNSIVMNHTEAGHFNYIGDSILGSYVNMGAGSRLANVQFRSHEEKKQELIEPIIIPLVGKEVETGLQKFGAILGDNVELGCNVVLCPGTLMAKDSWVYPNVTVSKGYYPPNTFLGPKERKLKIQDK